MAKKFFIITGEASGDILGAKLMKEIKSEFLTNGEDFSIVGVGGKMMKEEGLKSYFDVNELSVMGFFEILPHIPKILARINEVVAKIRQEKPDYLITIDAPDFNFRVVKKIQDLKGVKKIHMIAPSVWAYRENRAQKIAKLYDLLLTILPFEPPYFTKYGLRTKFIGHPIIENQPDFSKSKEKREKFRKNYNFKEQDKIIYLTPGSRIAEVKKIFTEFIAAINDLRSEFKDLAVVVVVTSKTEDLVRKMAKNIKVKYIIIDNLQKENALFASDYSLAKSGTNTLEASLYCLPMIICYKINSLTHFILKKMVKVKYVNLINLVMNKMIITELLQEKCNHKDIANSLKKLINDENLVKNQLEQSQEALKIMGYKSHKKSSRKAIEEIMDL